MTANRCDYTDLTAAECAHCRGDDPAVTAGDPRRFETVTPAARVVWPLPPTKPHHTPRPGEEPTDDPRVKVARDLRALRAMTSLVDARGEDLADNPEMPGGDAVVIMAPVSSPEAWESRYQTYERLGRPTSVDLEDDTWEPPLQTLLFWSEDWRRQLDMDYDQAPTLDSEANFLANADVIAWAWDNEPRFADFASDVAAARTRTENVVRDGMRETRSRVVCDRCDAGKRLILVHGKGERADEWKCPGCKVRLDADDMKRALAKQMRAAGAERWVEQAEAIGALRVQGWQERVVRKWIETLAHKEDRCSECGERWPASEHAACPRKVVDRGELGACGGDLLPLWRGDRDDVVEGWCDVKTRRTMLWWPSMWRKHLLATQQRLARGA